MYPLEEHHRIIAILDFLVTKRIMTKQEANDLFRNAKRPMTEKYMSKTKYIWN